MAWWGAFAFGVVLGWFLYYTNRYRKADVSLADLATLVGVIGGGAITSLFGESKGELFGAYGLGLATGFFAYFLTLIALVLASGGVFTLNWFLDGRRRNPKEDETILAETRPNVAPMDMRSGAARRAPTAFAFPTPTTTPSPLAIAVAERDRAITATADAMRELLRRIGAMPNESERNRLRDAHLELTKKFDELIALRLRDVLDSDVVRAALNDLAGITDKLVATAHEMKATTETLATAAVMIDRVSRLIGFLGGVFT
jgi:hypothetical protein